MALISAQATNKKTKLKAKEINSEVYNEMIEYCEWAGLNDQAYFIEESAKNIFKNDADWKKFKKNKS